MKVVVTFLLATGACGRRGAGAARPGLPLDRRDGEWALGRRRQLVRALGDARNGLFCLVISPEKINELGQTLSHLAGQL